MIRNKKFTSNKNWRLMLVGNHGSIIPLGPIKLLLFVLIFSLTLSLIGAAYLWFLYFDLKIDYSGLAQTFDQQQEQLQILRNKRDMLMAKLVIAESKLAPDNDVIQKESIQGLNEEPNTVTESTGEASPKTGTGTETQTATPQDSVLIKAQISDFKISHASQTNTINASYVLKNMSSDERLEGKCVLLLKGSINGESTTYPIPNVPWENGMPSARLGRPFYIRNFMTVTLSRSAPDQNFSFDRGIVYVFENRGEVILKKEFPIDLNSSVQEN